MLPCVPVHKQRRSTDPGTRAKGGAALKTFGQTVSARARAWWRGLLALPLALFTPRAAKALHDVPANASPLTALWTFPSVIGSAMMISWGAEAAQFYMSQGAALAILAWLQTLPEYAVEFVLAKSAAENPDRLHFVIANLTGSLRLLIGLGWPLIFFTALYFGRRKGKAFRGIQLEAEHSLAVLALLPAVLYWFVIWYKRSLSAWDAVALFAIYGLYLWLIRKVPPQEHEKIEDVDPIPRLICKQPPAWRNFWIGALFLGGGLILYFAASPFLESMLALSVVLGVPQFVFIQWLAPFLSEFPEKLSAFNWARRVSTASTGVMNMVSSNFNQWTVLAATLPLVYSYYSGEWRSIPFDDFQRSEILLTISQSVLAMTFLLNMHVSTREASGLFLSWLVQFVWADTRHWITAINFAWAGLELAIGLFSRRGFAAVRVAPKVLRGEIR